VGGGAREWVPPAWLGGACFAFVANWRYSFAIWQQKVNHMKPEANAVKHKGAQKKAVRSVVVVTKKGGKETARRIEVRRSEHDTLADNVASLLLGRGVAARKSGSAVALVRTGLPSSAIDRLRARLGYEDEDAILQIVGLSPRTYQRRKQDKKPLDAVSSDRLYRLAKIETFATEVFQDPETAVDWLKRPNRALGDTPINLLDTEAGTDMVERVLIRIQHGVYS